MKIPCEDCICFAICKAREVSEFAGHKKVLGIDHLRTQCKLFYKWYYNNNLDSESMTCLGNIFGAEYFLG